jgi:hypothetical protein
MTRTCYANFDGLSWPTEYTMYSTGHELMLAATAAMKYASFRQVAGQSKISIRATRLHAGQATTSGAMVGVTAVTAHEPIRSSRAPSAPVSAWPKPGTIHSSLG